MMFINLTNHPSDKWGEDQMAAASLYGEIVDWPFPMVKPSASHDDIRLLAEDIHSAIINKYGKRIAAIHIMGELTLCHALILLFRTDGITCIASTTERIASESSDGTKTSLFKFVQFREY